MKKTYIFDFDGTLVDSIAFARKVSLGFLRERGINYPKNISKITTPLGWKGMAAYYVEAFSLRETPNEIYSILYNRISIAYKQDIPAKPMADYVLRELTDRGHSLNILTASPRELVEICVKRLGWENLFDNILSTEQFKLNKSNPQVFIEAANALGKNREECLIIDDNINALSNAKKAGFEVVGIYDEYSADVEAEIRGFVDKYIWSLEELL